ncbi:hypothetical protein VNI00_007482 [Paramarasmius palmivorus]|uniref:Uncharacterized protein n=1 Tax=Paramarasmius palmivorus TaxID=297713 RepID=A0AAW0D520_9AGAR
MGKNTRNTNRGSAANKTIKTASVEPPPTQEPLPSESPAQTASSISDDSASHHSHTTTATMVDLQTPIDSKAIISPEIKALSELLGTMKLTLGALGSTVHIIGKQTEKVAALAPAIKASEEIDHLRVKLDQQMAIHKEEITKLRAELTARVKEAIRTHLREQASMAVKDAVARKVSSKVADLLATHVSEDLRDQVKAHRRQLLDIQTNMHNSEARRHNSSLRSSADTLRPLVRPLSASQLLGPPLDTPLSSLTTAVEPPTPSLNFPKSLGEVYTLSTEDARNLLKEYGINLPNSPKNNGTPTTGQISPDCSPSSAASSATMVDWREASREEIINTFMAHIGVRSTSITARSDLCELVPGGEKVGVIYYR